MDHIVTPPFDSLLFTPLEQFGQLFATIV